MIFDNAFQHIFTLNIGNSSSLNILFCEISFLCTDIPRWHGELKETDF